MKATSLVLLSVWLACSGYSQNIKRVNWSYYVKKIADQTYEVHLRASLEPKWAIYAMTQPENSIAQPTTITFTKNPLIALTGAPQEKGKLERKKYENLGLESLHYHNTVEFVQTVTVKRNVKTNLEGAIAYQVCNDQTCMPPDVSKFNLYLE